MGTRGEFEQYSKQNGKAMKQVKDYSRGGQRMAEKFLKDPESRRPKVTQRTVEWRGSSVARALPFSKLVSHTI